MTQDIVEDEIGSWSGFSSILTNGDDQLFNQMLNEYREYKEGIKSK